MYRSRDQALMEDLKKSVLDVTKGYDKSDRKYALDYLRTHIKVDDLHQYALKKFPNKTILFGTGSLVPKIVIVTKDPISDEHQAKLNNVWTKMKLTEDDVYYAHLRFVKTKKKQDIRMEIFEKLLHMLHPRVILSFDGVESPKFKEITEHVILIPHSIDIISKEDATDERKELTKRLKEVRPILKD